MLTRKTETSQSVCGANRSNTSRFVASVALALAVWGASTPAIAGSSPSALSRALLQEPVAYGPQAGAGAVGIFADAGGTNCNLSATAPTQIVDFYVVHVNTDGATGVAYMAPKPACFPASYLTDINAAAIVLGNSQTGVTAGYGSCLDGAIHVQTIRYLTTAPAPACCAYPVLPNPSQDPAHVVIADCDFNTVPAEAWIGMINDDGSCPDCGPTPGPSSTIPTVPFAVLGGRVIQGIAFDADLSVLWAVHSLAGGGGDDCKISKIDPMSGEVLAESGDFAWNGRGITVANGMLWVADARGDSVYALDRMSFAVAGNFATPGSEPCGFGFDGTHLWLTDPNRGRIDELTTSGSLVGGFAIPNAFRFGLEWDGEGMWTNTDSTTISFYTTDGTITSSRDFGSLPGGTLLWDVAIGGSRFYLSSGNTIYLGPPDGDGDGVDDLLDQCPFADASFFDRDGDGCTDEYVGARHIEYWAFPGSLEYFIQQDGAPNIGDGSDFTAIQQAVDGWAGIVGVDMSAQYAGTTSTETAVAGDGVNLVTFRDLDYDFGVHTLAVGIATSFVEPAFANGRFYRAGEIIDADMLFNPAKTFTTSGGAGTDLQSVATHEAGHLYGISHSAAKSSIMFYALQGGATGRSPKLEDVTIAQKAYPDSTWVLTTRRLFGTVADRFAQPVPGAIVFLTDAASNDTLGCDMTLPDGSFKFLVMPPATSVLLSIHAIDGTSAIGYLEPGYVNALVDSTAVTLFPAELWNTGDSFDEDPALGTPIALSTAQEYGPFDFVINEDTSGPSVIDHSPAHAAVNVRADAAVLIEFSEAIDANTLQGNFRLFNQSTLTGTGGNALVAADGTFLAFTPSAFLDYSTAYICTLRTGIEDLYGNPMPSLYSFQFTTEAEPPLTLSSLVPNKGTVGSIVVFNGAGFDTIPSGNTVAFADESGLGTVTATVLSASKTQLVAAVPAGAGTGNVVVTVGALTSNPASFALLESTGVPRGYEVDAAALGSVPRSIAISPDGDFAYVATAAGATAVDADPDSPTFLDLLPIAVPGGLVDLAVTPDGNWVFAVSGADSAIYVIDCSSLTIVDELPVFAVPKGISIAPSGNRAYVPTDAGEIQVWDVNANSATYRMPLGALTATGSSFIGKTAVGPDGDCLVALTAEGNLISFDLGPDTLEATVSVGYDLRDVVIDPAGQRAYVSDGSGTVSIISMSGYFKILDVPTSGSLRGVAVTPSGEYLYAANRQLNFLDVVDLVETSAAYRTVATTIPVGVNPVDVDISPDGLYAYSLVEDAKSLVVTGIGSGPVIRSISRRAGPPGTTVVAAGEGFGSIPGALVVKFMDSVGSTYEVAPDRTTGRTVAFSVPTGAEQGLGMLRIERLGPPDEASNAVSFEVLSPLETEHLGPVLQRQIESGVGVVSTAAMSPLGDQFLVGTEDGQVLFIDTEPNSPTFNQKIEAVGLSTSPVYDIVVTPDGERAYASVPDDQAVRIIDAKRSSPGYATVVGSVSLGAFPVDTPQELAVSPDGELLLVQDIASNLLYYVPILPGTPFENQAIAVRDVVIASEMVFNARGTHAYLALEFEQDVSTVCVDSSDTNFWTETSRVSLDELVPGHPLTPLSLSMSPKGDRCVVLADDDLSAAVYLVLFDTSNPDTTMYMTSYTFGDTPPPPPPLPLNQHLDISPGGDRLIYHQNGVGVVSVGLSDFGFGSRRLTDTPFTRLSEMDHDFSADGGNLYAVGSYGDTLQVYAFTGAVAGDTLSIVSGDGQSGVSGVALASPLRVQVRDFAGPKADVLVTFEVASGGGLFAGTNTGTQIVATDANGYGEVEWQLGAVIGAQHVTATSAVSEGSPVSFAATAVVDPNTLPLQLVSVIPADGTTNLATTSTIVATFSRPVANSGVTTSSVYLHETGETAPVLGKFGYADNNRLISITPSSSLDFSTSYTLEITGAVQDEAGGFLENPTTVVFTTGTAPPLFLQSVSPPSGTVGITIVLAGVSFDPTPSQNEVYFDTKKATPFAGAFDYLKVVVPPDAESGNLRVYNGVDTSNALPFNVLVPANVAADEVVATASTGTATKGVTINPDGSMAYALSPDDDVVVPIDVVTKTSLPPIGVGDLPISIDVHPDGTFAYIPNFNSGTLSIIDVDKNSIDYHRVVETLIVGNFPNDVVVSPDGDRVYVVNSGADVSKNIDIIDSDHQSANFHSVVATASTGQASRGVTINPDGTRLYVGTTTGYVVLNAGDESFGVVGMASTGSAAKGVTINPDGSLLFVLTANGDVFIFNVLPNSQGVDEVVATVQGGSATKGITLNPDGSILYLIKEENDVIDIVGIDIQGTIGVIESGGSVPPFQVVTTPLGSIFAGEDPEAIVFDPTGSGLALVTNSGPKTVTFLNTTFVTVELPAGPIQIPAFSTVPPIELTGFEMKNVLDSEVSYAYSISTSGPATLSGGLLSSPGPSPSVVGSPSTMGGVGPSSAPVTGGPASFISTQYTEVSGVTPVLAPGDSFAPPSAILTIPGIQGHVEQDLIYSVSMVGNPVLKREASVHVVIDGPVPVLVSRFHAEALDEGVRLTWEVASDGAILGYRIYRLDAGSEAPVIANTEGLIPVDEKEWVDPAAAPGRDYEYTLGVVVEGGEVLSQTINVTTKKLELALYQNHPNPFNPSTTIEFTLPQRQRVRLSVYNVAGQRVITLVDQVMAEGRRKVTWDGRNSGGEFVGTGVYFYRLQAGEKALTRKMMLLK